MFFIPLGILVSDSFLPPFFDWASFCVQAKLVDLVLGISDMLQVPGVGIQKTVGLFCTQVERWKRLWNILWQLPVIIGPCMACQYARGSMGKADLRVSPVDRSRDFACSLPRYRSPRCLVVPMAGYAELATWPTDPGL
jgi:hypothetical protein